MMTEQMPMNMARITELMRSGDLAQATQMIQSGLGGGAMPRMPTGGLSMPQMPKMPQMPTGFPTGTTARGGAPVDLPDGATWTTHQHQAAGQSREYRLYLPASLDGRPAAGLLLLLHGCTQDPDDFARGTGIMAAAERHRVIVVAPAQTAQANMNRCWNWFEARHTARDGGEAAFPLLSSLVASLTSSLPKSSTILNLTKLLRPRRNRRQQDRLTPSKRHMRPPSHCP